MSNSSRRHGALKKRQSAWQVLRADAHAANVRESWSATLTKLVNMFAMAVFALVLICTAI